VSSPRTSTLERAQEELRAAAALVEAGYPTQAVSRAYYAVFHAAQTALAAVGQARSRHAGVISAFGQYVARDDGLDGAHGRTLHELFDARNRADYQDQPASAEDAETALTEARAFVVAVAAWLETREA
jgi:uncharacterized protein (UPF0332 family)